MSLSKSLGIIMCCSGERAYSFCTCYSIFTGLCFSLWKLGLENLKSAKFCSTKVIFLSTWNLFLIPKIGVLCSLLFIHFKIIFKMSYLNIHNIHTFFSDKNEKQIISYYSRLNHFYNTIITYFITWRHFSQSILCGGRYFGPFCNFFLISRT